MDILPLAMLALMAGAFWLLILRPAKARQAAAAKLVSEIQVGQRVMTTAGMFGYVREITDEEVALEISDGVTVWMVKAAIAKTAEASDLQTPADQAEPATVSSASSAASEGEAKTVSLDTAGEEVIDLSQPK